VQKFSELNNQTHLLKTSIYTVGKTK